MFFFSLTLFSTSARATSSIEEQWEPFVNDTFLRLHKKLEKSGKSGKKETVFLRAGAHMWEAPSSGGEGWIKYWIGHEPMQVLVENWEYTGNELKAGRIVFQRPVVRIFQGIPFNLDSYLEGRKMFQSEPVTRSEKDPETFEIGQIVVKDGKVEMVNTDVSPAYTLEMVDVNGTVSGLTVPDWLLHTPFEYDLEMFINSSQPAMVKAHHVDTTKPDDINFDFDLKIEGLDLAYLSPFIIAEEGWSLNEGKLDLVVDATSVNNQFHSLNKVTLDGLSFSTPQSEEGSINDFALRILLSASKSVLGPVRLDYEVEGDLADPDFDLGEEYEKAIQENMTQWLILQTLRRIGMEDNPTLRKQFGLDE